VIYICPYIPLYYVVLREEIIVDVIIIGKLTNTIYTYSIILI